MLWFLAGAFLFAASYNAGALAGQVKNGTDAVLVVGLHGMVNSSDS
jgi:hypothetical protein